LHSFPVPVTITLQHIVPHIADEQGQPVTYAEYYPCGDAWFQEGNTHHAPKYDSQEVESAGGNKVKQKDILL